MKASVVARLIKHHRDRLESLTFTYVTEENKQKRRRALHKLRMTSQTITALEDYLRIVLTGGTLR